MLFLFQAFEIKVIAADFLILSYALIVAFKDTVALQSANAKTGFIILLIAVEAAAGTAMALIRWRLFIYLLPLVPLLTRGAISLVYYKFMSTFLDEEAKQRGDYRTVILGLMGFSLASLLALTVVEAHAAQMFFDPVYYMLVSFLGFYLALNIQSYKDNEWQDQLGAALMDVATLSFFLSIVSLFFTSNQDDFYKYLLTALALGTWLADHLIRLIKEGGVYQDKLTD
jgi:hypothetical protein